MRQSFAGSICAVVAFLLVTTKIHAQDQQYGVVCPLFTVYKAPGGQYVEYCNAYATDCNDIPDGVIRYWDAEPEPCDCPDSSGCIVAGGGTSFTNALLPVAEKVAANGLPIGFSKKAVIAKSANVYILKDGEPVYFRILHCVFEMDGRSDQTCAYSMGFEMKSPLTGVNGLTEVTTWKSTDDPNILQMPRGDRVIYLVRAAMPYRSPSPAPTPAPTKQSQSSLQQASLRTSETKDVSADHSILKKSDSASL